MTNVERIDAVNDIVWSLFEKNKGMLIKMMSVEVKKDIRVGDIELYNIDNADEFGKRLFIKRYWQEDDFEFSHTDFIIYNKGGTLIVEEGEDYGLIWDSVNGVNGDAVYDLWQIRAFFEIIDWMDEHIDEYLN